MTLLPMGVLPLTGCGGRTANPVAVVQAGDTKLSCDALRTEMGSVEAQVGALIPESKKTGKNVALGAAGLFLIVPFFFMDGGGAEKAEIRAFRARYAELQKQYAQKGCDTIGAEAGGSFGAMDTKQKLVELKELFEEGLITEDEYEKAKQALLDIE